MELLELLQIEPMRKANALKSNFGRHSQLLVVLSCVLLSFACTDKNNTSRQGSQGATKSVNGLKGAVNESKSKCNSPVASSSTADVTDVNPPTWTWSPCNPASTKFSVSLDQGAAVTVMTTSFSPSEPIKVGAHVLTVAEYTPSGELSNTTEFKLTLSGRPVTSKAHGAPSLKNLNQLTAELYYGYLTDDNGKQIPPDKITLAGASGFSPDDVRQGGIGDCFFEATLAAIASAQPNVLSRLIQPATDSQGNPLVDASGYPLFSITFIFPTASGAMQSWSYLTDVQLPMDSSGNLVFTEVVSDQEGSYRFGPALIEKAFARLNEDSQYIKVINPDSPTILGNGYGDLDQGGLPKEVIPALTRQLSTDLSAADDRTTTLSQIQYGDGQAAVVCTITADSFSGSIRLPSGATVTSGNNTLNKTAGSDLIYTSADGQTVLNLPSSHCYSYLGTQGSIAMVRNPWGKSSLNNDYKYGYGTFTIPVEDLSSELFDIATMVKLN